MKVSEAITGGGGTESSERAHRPLNENKSAVVERKGAAESTEESASLPKGESAVSLTPKKMRFGGNLSIMQSLHLTESDGDKSSNREVSSEDGGSGSPSDESEARTRLLTKIETAKMKLAQINIERENELEEFLSMSKKVEDARGNDNPQMVRIRQHYEKKNKRHTHNTELLRKKLETYEIRLADLDGGGAGGGNLDTSRSAQQMISTVGQGIRRTGANLKEMTGTVILAPFELAHKLKKSTFGSADNLPDEDAALVGQSTFYRNSPHSARSTDSGAMNGEKKASTLPPNMRPPDKNTPELAGMTAVSTAPAPLNREGSPYSFPRRPELLSQFNDSNSDTDGRSLLPSSSQGVRHHLDDRPILSTPAHFTEEILRQMLAEIKGLKKQNTTLVQHLDTLQERVDTECRKTESALMEERFRTSRLEGQLHESSEVHAAEISALRRELELTASRLDYQYNDRLNRFDDKLENTQHHMLRVEKSLKESLDLRNDGSWYSALLLSGATILMELLKIGLYLVAALLDLIRPFTGSRWRVAFFVLLLACVFLIVQKGGSLPFSPFSPSSSSSSKSSSLPNSTTNSTPTLPSETPTPNL